MMQLDIWQKRQAALIYYFASKDYLLALQAKLQGLISGADILLDKAEEQGRDSLIVNQRWGVRDTAVNWSSYGFPALLDFRQSIAKQLAKMEHGDFQVTGANQCANMLREISSRWMSEEEEETFKQRFDLVYAHAMEIDDVMSRPPNCNDFNMQARWREYSSLFPRLPRFRVREEVVVQSGQKPPRAGVYIPLDDPYGTLQFAWPAGDSGALDACETLNPAAQKIAQYVGRDVLWTLDSQLIRLTQQAIKAGDLTELGPYQANDAIDPEIALNMLAFAAFTQRPCSWCLIELVEGEFDDDAAQGSEIKPPGTRNRVDAGQPCPKEGWWLTPARSRSRRYFKVAEVMPDFGESSDYGFTIWQWDLDQSAPTL